MKAKAAQQCQATEPTRNLDLIRLLLRIGQDTDAHGTGLLATSVVSLLFALGGPFSSTRRAMCGDALEPRMP